MRKMAKYQFKVHKCESISYLYFQHRMLVNQIHNLNYCGNVQDFSKMKQTKHKLQVMHC